MLGKGLARSLRGIDFYGSAGSKYAEGTVSGACISVVSITVLVILVMSAVSTLMSPIVTTDLIIDSKHSQDKLKYGQPST